ncbi:hypothetical protein N7462_001005 [Penicillium macrosclerotiorum]|uniref:uncharacterized protein n=1 Tax=Penicillium macrosclerotiorum TaxID=303699 RepID=UPI002548A8BC|nr:uncharacterized protein N7462_001005 [Penicillium macrosclerotiorum]KAJ5699000.1 hypothetical protein N7462_001005 [Penicillium macrosclerotiorum]
MSKTLRRSCSACANFKHSCDRRTPSCSRCIKRRVLCVYANEPWTIPPGPAGREHGTSIATAKKAVILTSSRFGSLDPFESYPSTRLPRERVQRLIHNFLHKIAFQYYPLDLNATSNPFLISWWPLALGDPALFHVSLQTASLDEELLAQKGFQMSELLMADSVALLRRKIEEPSLAVQDGTMNSVITLATIEFGKGNMETSQMHVEGVKQLVKMRGGINAVRQTSPLTARMVSWVTMLIMGHPQFNTQNDLGFGDGIPPIPEWQIDPASLSSPLSTLTEADMDSEVKNVFDRLRRIFALAQDTPFQSTQLHDLACFVIHRLLPSLSDASEKCSHVSESVRYAIILYMFLLQGPTYYSHATILNSIATQLLKHLKHFRPRPSIDASLNIWLLSIGMVASFGTDHYHSFLEKARENGKVLNLASYHDSLVHLKNILWLDAPHITTMFRPHWDIITDAPD